MQSISTSRLLLREFTVEDVGKSFENWAGDENISAFLLFYPHESVKQTRDLIQGYVESYKNPNTYIWAIALKDTNQVIGQVSIDPGYPDLKIGEIAYLLGSKWWHHGYATEAAKAVIEFMFYKQDYYMVEAKYNKENIASGMLLERAGMTVDGVLRGRRINKKTGERNDLVISSVTRDEWK